MASESGKAWNHIRLLHAATEGLQRDGGSSPGNRRERNTKKSEEEKASVSSETGEEHKDRDEDEEGSSSSVHGDTKNEGMDEDGDKDKEGALSLEHGDTKSEGVGEDWLAQLRSHLRAQFSIQDEQEDPSPERQLKELVEKIIHREGEGGTLTANNAVSSRGPCPACGQCSKPTGCTNGFPTELEKTLQRELAVLKGEVTASIESMRREVVEELSSLREAFRAYSDHNYLQTAELSPLEELDENIPEQLKGGHPRIPQGGKMGGTISMEEKFKSWSVPTLHPLPVSGRNQAMMRAMSSTMSAKNSFMASLARSHSDPVEPMQGKSSLFPPAIPKLTTKSNGAKMMPPPSTRTYASSSGKYGSKMASRSMAPHPPHGDSEGKLH